MNKEEIQETLKKERDYVEQLKKKLDEATRKSIEVFDKLHNLLVFNPNFVDENESEVSDSLQKEVIYDFGAIIGEFYRNDNGNVAGETIDERQAYWLNVWRPLTGETGFYFGDQDDDENSEYANIRVGSEVFKDATLEQIKNDLLAIEANLVAELSYALRGDIKYNIAKFFINESSREALLLAHFRIKARVADWCRANPELIYDGEKVEGKFAEAYNQILTFEESN